MRVIRRVEFDDLNECPSFQQYQGIYRDINNTGNPIPNTQIWYREKLMLQINSLGCKGPELNSDEPIIGVFGDSTVFGIRLTTDCWPREIKVPGWQVLNAGVEGFTMERSLQRLKQLAKQIKFSAVVFLPGLAQYVLRLHRRAFLEVGA